MLDKLLKAVEFATEAHKGQKRKYTGEDYITHPLTVALIVSSFGGSEDQIIAAILHDTVEDTETTLEDISNEFGPLVSEKVKDLTDVSKPDDGNRSKRKKIDRDHLANVGPLSKTIKIADLIHNTSSICKHDTSFAEVYLKEKSELLEVLKEGNSQLHAYATELVNRYTDG